MQIKKHILPLVAAAAVGTFSSMAMAQEVAGTSYIGGALGQGDTNASGLDSDTAMQIFGGYMFTENFGLEGGYAKYGKFESATASTDVDGFYAAGVGRYQINDKFRVVGKLGLVHYGFENKANGAVVSSGDGSAAMFGVGVDYTINEQMAVGAEYDIVNGVEDDDVSAFWINFTYNLGQVGGE